MLRTPKSRFAQVPQYYPPVYKYFYEGIPREFPPSGLVRDPEGKLVRDRATQSSLPELGNSPELDLLKNFQLAPTIGIGNESTFGVEDQQFVGK
ncbi:MAG: hypothetical protein HRU27_19690 [Rhizobiaceae bacterium]|nr:hypothetical protein [Rhizobiaceae bacterium]